MANDVVTGIRWVRNRNGGPMPVERGVVITNQTGAIFTGDPVKRVSDGTFIVAAGGDTSISHVCLGVERYTDANSVIQAGAKYLPDGADYTGAPSLGNPNASVLSLVPVRHQVFEMDMNTAETSLTTAQTSVGNNIDVSVGTGSTINGRSACVGANSSPGTSTANVRILEIVQSPKNDVTAVNWKALVEFVEGTEPAPGSATGT